MEHETPSIHSPENNVDDNRRFLGVSSVAALIAMLAALIMVTGVTLTPDPHRTSYDSHHPRCGYWPR